MHQVGSEWSEAEWGKGGSEWYETEWGWSGVSEEVKAPKAAIPASIA